MANTTPLVKIEQEVYGHGNASRPRIYTCREYEVRVQAANRERGIRVIVNTPEGDPDEEVLGELIAAIIKDQKRG